jgi:uncharacterized linocin/CFP29 family protein
MDILKRSLAPIPAEAWSLIDEEARQVLKGRLTGRRFVDFNGPLGLEFSSLNTGRLLAVDAERVDDQMTYKIRKSLPVVEVRFPFRLKIEELEALVRGAQDVEIDPLLDAAKAVADAEDNAVLFGLKPVSIQGVIAASPHKALSVSKENEKVISVLARGMKKLRDAYVDGPYALVAGTEMLADIQAQHEGGYPILNKIRDMLGGEIIKSPFLGKEGALVSTRGGDYELFVGQDLSIGFERQDGVEVALFMFGTFTFRVNTPEACVPLK